MNTIFQIIVGVALVLFGWATVRSRAGARMSGIWSVCLDACVPAIGFLELTAVTAKPTASGISLFAVLLALAHADAVKRKMLREPIVFFDVYQTMDVIVRHPQVDILQSLNWRAIVAIGAGAGGLFAILWLEPALWPWTPWPGLLGLVALAVAVVIVSDPLLQPTASWLRKLGATGDAISDSAKLGFFAMQVVHVVLARAERPERRAASRAGGLPTVRTTSARSECPVIVVQSESFFDARRLHPDVPADLLPAFDRYCANGEQWGRLSVPGIGGNTMRTEFAALTGLSESAIGFDRFNPYQAFARVPVRSIAWRLRAEGYRTICIHPFDRRFYRRDIVMNHLGFDTFLGEEAFSRPPGSSDYILDSEVAALTLELLREEGPKLFVFAITMQNHGPWSADASHADSEIHGRIPLLADDPALVGFIAGLHESDQMLGSLSAELDARGDNGLIAFYGDHLPSFPATFAKLGFADRHSDYVITRPIPGAARRVDLAAYELSDAIMASLSNTNTAARSDRSSVAMSSVRKR